MANDLGRWLAARSESEALWMLLIPGIAWATFFGNRFEDCKDDEAKAKLLVAAGGTMLLAGAALKGACLGQRTGGVCALMRGF